MLFFFNFPDLFPKSTNPQAFLLECLEDLDNSLKKVGARLHVFMGCPIAILRNLHLQFKINTLSVADDYETIWVKRNQAIDGNRSFLHNLIIIMPSSY